MEAKERQERLIEAAMAILGAAPNRRLKAVLLNKALFYLDLASLRDHGEVVTGAPYIAIAQGPVVANYKKRLISQLESRHLAVQREEWDGSMPIERIAEPGEFRFLSGASLELAGAVSRHFAQQTSSQASEYSHENPGWKLAWTEFLRSRKPSAINMLVAMQQIIEDDPWMDLPLSEDEESLLATESDLGTAW